MSRTALFGDRSDLFAAVVDPLRRQFWMIVLIVTVGSLSSLAYSKMQAPSFEASAVVQVQPGTDLSGLEAALTTRERLISTALRQGLDRFVAGTDRAALSVYMRRSMAVNDLAADAGQSLGFDPEVTGVVISVLLPDAETSSRVANDLAQQVLEMGNGGGYDPIHADLAFYRGEEERLWQESSALKAELDTAARAANVDAQDLSRGQERRLILMLDQYKAVRDHLAEVEIAARKADQGRQGQFSLLQRATSTEAITVMRDFMMVGVAGSLLLAVALAFVLERRYPALKRGPWDDMGPFKAQMIWAYRQFDDPARPIFGVPRYIAISGAVVLLLVGLSETLR